GGFAGTPDNAAGASLYLDDICLSIETAPPVVDPVLEIVGAEFDEAAGEARVEFTSIPEREYIIEFSTDLANWLEETDDFPADPEAGTTTFTETGLVGVPRRYYRITLVPLPPE
ncbi:MAG: hypothetical protein ACR2RV_26975, partial [Verrucomicrobiales bacterium]